MIAEPKVLYDNKGLDVIWNSASKNPSYIKNENAREKFCAGSGADVVRTGGFGLSLSGSEGTEQGSVGMSNAHGVADLGGRSAALLFTRELMYRACELSLNTDSDRDQAMEIYKLLISK
ncbi:MAG: hypothetical protein IH605_20200 [Burkholderiales bacterium]|nr:hypothetical protein [Burkholderiales bacterium]